MVDQLNNLSRLFRAYAACRRPRRDVAGAYKRAPTSTRSNQPLCVTSPHDLNIPLNQPRRNKNLKMVPELSKWSQNGPKMV